MSTVKDVSEFYGKLQGSNAFIGLPEEQEFVQMFDNTQARRGLYEQLRNSGRINGLPDTFEEFSLAFGYNASGDSRPEQKRHNREVAEDNLRAMREDGLIEEAKGIKKDAAKSKRQARRRTIAEYITSPKMTGTATGVAQPIGQQIAEQNVENALQNEEYRESAELYGEERLLHRTMRDALRDAKNVERGVIGQWTAPLAQKIFNISTWDMGVSEGLDNLTLSALLEKADNGTITESEEMLLDTLALANVIQQNADAAKSGVTKVAEALPQSFAFMAQMAANPATGFTRSIAKRAVKKYGVDAMEMGAKELMRNYGGKALARKVGAGLAASVPETAAFATTVGAARSIADAERKAQGNIQTYVDDNGYIQYAGHTEGEDLPTALLKSFGSTFIESWSEILGTAAFDPMLSLLKGVKSGKMMSSLADLKKGLNAIKGSEWSVAIKNFKKNAHWDGIINEMLGEEVGMVMSGLFNIENTLNRYNEDGTINENWILDGGNLLRTLLTIALTEGHMKAVEHVGNIGELRKMENNLKIAESDGAKTVGARWGEIQKEIDELDPDGVADYIMSLASDPAITNEMLAAATNYATTLVRWQQYNLATDTQEYDDMSEVMRNAMTAYNAGRQMHIANFRSVQQRADKAYDALAKRDADLLKRADEWLEQQKQTGKLPAAEIETIRNGLSADISTLLDEYIGAMTARQGIYDKIDDTAYSQMDIFERDLAPVIRDGAVTTATLDGKPVYVLSQENGSAVILSEDAETEHEGKGMMVDASRLKDISTIDAKQLVDAYRYRYATDEQTKADMALNHHPNTQMPTVGMQIDTPSAVEGGATTFIVTNVQPQMGYVELVPGEYDAEQGKVVPKDGAEPIYQTVYSTLQMQDEMYDALDAMNGVQSVQVESGIIEDNEQTEEEAPVVVPTEEEVAPTEEEVATEETAPAERSQAEIDADDAAELAELGDNDYISSNLDKAKKVLDKAKKKKPKATEKDARLAEARTIKAEVDAAQAEVDRWTAASQEVARRALQATQTEQAPTGESTGVGENIQSSWAEAEKIEGNTGSKTLQDGTVIKGRYMLVPASAPTASHDALNGYAPSAGFSTNERGQNINDRDYHSDKAAQAETDRIARVYGGQAVSDTPVVSPEGIVYSGNGRTMASQLAAANGTDAAYMEALRSNAAQFGFTPEQVDSIPNARVVFVTDEVLPYTTETFAKFNQQEKKTQSSTERAVSKSKSLKDKSIARILSIIDSYDTLQSFFSSPKACADMLSVLQQDGVITEAEVAGLTELNSSNETVLSATGRDLVTDVVLGATFSEQTLRQMGGDKALKQSVLRALPSIIENRQLKEYALNNELEKAISLLYEARKAKMSLEQFLQSTDMFEGSPTDRYSAFEVLLAEKFNNSTEAFRVMMQLYNNSALTLVGGQSELFGEALTKEDIQNLILEKYGKQTNNRGDQAESVTQSESGNRQDNETTAAERRAKYGITAKEDARREPLRERAREVAEKLGTNINVIEDKSEVTNEDAKKQMRQHKNSIVKGWFENSTGELFIVLPSMDDMADLEATILHELVAHKGLRNLLGARKFNQLCDAVWEMMTPEQQQEWLAYPGVNGSKRAAADEYIASLAEKMGLSEVEQTTWSKIKQFVLDVLQKLGFRDITENDIQDLIRASYAYMRAGNTNEQTTNEGNRYKVYRSRDGKEVGYTQLSQLSLQFDWGERERDTVSGRNTDVLQREDDATLATLNTLRQLNEGEVCNVERIFTESKGFDFTSGEKIESAADVAYIFKNLEDEAIENVFVALVKDGKPTVIHVGMGGQAYSLVDNSAVVAAANRINPDKVYLVHNHPSGSLRCSPQDRSMLKSVKDALGDVVQDGIIINTRSGKFGVFSESMFGTDGTSDMPENKEDSPLKVYKFNKQAFKSNVVTVETNPYGIAEFISTQRLGSRNKINALLLNNQFGCVGNVFLTETEVNDTNRDSIAQRLVDDAVAMNAKNIVIYGNYPLVSVAVESNIQLREAIEKASGKTVELKDVIEINGSAFPPSALDYGVRFRTTIAPEVREEMESIKADAIANGTFLKAPNGKDTSLNEEQWLMVRTNNFKKWFGDWMKAARIEKLRKSKAINVDYNNEYELNRESAKAWMKDNLRGEYVNKDTGEKIQVSKVGINEVTSHGSKDMAHLKSLVAIPSFIKDSIFIDEVENAKANDKYDSYRYYVCGAKIDGEDYTVKVVIGVKGDSKYYDHRLTQIEKGTLIDNLNGLSNSVAENQNANNSIGKDSKLISILQTNSSKIVDENGEPMVVYHGTDSEFTSFEMQDGSIGRGAYFTSNWDEAAQYAMEKQGVENIDELDESKIKEVFLNVRDEKNITHSRFSRGDIEALATSPNQIKSATDNNGEFGENNDIRFRTLEERKALRDSEESKIIFDTAKEKFGTTYDLREAGYILPDGSMLDFSGKHEIRGADTSFLNGQRSVDHRAIQDIAYDFDENETGVKTDLGDFLDRGAIRIDYNTGAINLNIPPTSKQKDILRRLIERNDGYVYVDFGNGWDTEHYAEYEDTTSRRILNDIDRYYSEGIKPAGGIRFRVANENQEIFVSNAQRAVEGIKQDKATPEQWLAMITKQGGLKAGEDKWLGLSDWLKSSDTKTITKQEILDFIAENKIKIEEVNYTGGGTDMRNYRDLIAKSRGEEFADKFYKAFDIEYDEFIIDDENLALELYNAENEPHIELDGDGYWKEGDDMQTVIDWAESIYNEAQGDLREINSTRLHYTTEGLDNNREIALTVPTIESWNQGDEVHFDDAGNGRAIAWIRFGETEAPVQDSNYKRLQEIYDRLSELEMKVASSEGITMEEYEERARLREERDSIPESENKRILVIDEIQSKRHQEGREKGYAKGPKVSLTELLQKARNFEREMIDKYHPKNLGLVPFASAMRGVWTEEESNTYSEMMSALGGAVMKGSGIPDAPFDKNWHELAMKRMLRLAAEEGYDYVAWTTGAQQAERYNLGSRVDEIKVADGYDGVFTVIGRKDGGILLQKDVEGEQGLAELLGTDLARKAYSNLKEGKDDYLNEDGAVSFTGEDLVIGGEGMKGFYDKMLPSFVSKYTKKWGAKVEDIELPQLEESARVMHSVNITPEMKESVMQGQTMFRIGNNEQTENIQQENIKDRIENLFNQAISGEFKGKSISIGTLTDEGREYLEQISGVVFKDKVDFVLNPSDLVHIYKDHFGNNEKDKGQNIPLDIEDIRNLADVITIPDKVVFFKEGEGNNRNMFYFFKEAENGTYNLMEIYSDRRGNLTAKTFYKTRKDASQRVMDIKKSLLPTSETYFGAILSDTKIPQMFENPTIAIEETADEAGTSFRVVTDKATLDRLNSEPTIKVYRAMQLIDGKLYPPMSAVVDGKLREPSEIGAWEEAEENPELADEKGYFKLNKGNKKSVPARYNPYFHTSRTPLNDQFASAQDRPELVTVEVEVPESELTSDYKAEKAKDSVGAMQWKAGVVQSKLSGKREVILSRWAKPIRIVPDSEVADEIVKMFDGKDITMPSNVVTPSLRAELEKRGVPFIETDNQGKEIEDRTMFSVKQRTEADYQDIENRLGIAAAEYERRMDMASVHHMEAWQDSMRSLLEMQRAIEKETGKPILDYENAYMAENRMSSENLAQMEEWKRKFFRPLEDIYKGFIDRGENEFSIRDYLFAKHGMERNAVMARREAQRLYPNDPLQQIAKESDLKRTKDYSGLKKLMGKDNIPDAIAEAQKYVQDFEKKHKAEIAKLWDAIRNATHSQLEVQRASGLLTQEKYEEIKNMYNYYVPLRGFSETTTDEVYDYLDNAPTPYNVPIKAAKGRKSVGDDPIANIANMAESGIMQANRNKMKLHFLNMAERHKTNLVTVSEVIYKYNPVAKMWEPTLPALSPNDTIEETLAKIQQHKAKIAQEMVFNPQDYRFERDLKKMGRDIPYKVINKAMLSEHQVLVMREGKQMVMTINGNPRAAQALNGLTNPEVKAEEQRWIQKANRFMAANFTSRNPAFVISNLSRDSIYAVSMVWAKEAPKYARAFMNNMGKVFANMASLMRKYNNGTLDTNVPMEKMFLEFVMNGGQTGYTHLNSVEDYKRQMAKEMKRAAQHKGVRAVTETGRAILNGLESMNKWAENISRFTAYVTSREDGRSISRSISDAKEISVNFNKKGAGNSVAGKFEKGNRLNYLSSQTAQLARGLYVFMNAGIQGMANFAKQAKRHPYKITAMIASSMALGLAAALLSGGGDDEEEYLSLPKYTRRNNLCIKVGDKFVTIPLPIELRAFYGIGELIASRTALGEYYSDAEFAKEFAEQLSQLLPIDVLEGGEGFNIKSFIPSAAKPIVDVILNESWTGIPIYNDSEFVKTYPGWKKAYKGTNDMLVDVSRWLNEVSGGSDYRQGWANINPAAIEYIAEQYLGGVGSTINQFFKMGQTATGAMEFEWRNVPVASRFVNSGNETTQIRAIRNSYYDYREEMDAVGKEFNAYMRDLKNPDLKEEEYQRIEQEIDRIVNSPEYDFYLWWKDINKVINRAKDAGDTEGADELMREAVETYRSWKKGLKE